MKQAYKHFREELGKVTDVRNAAGLLGWDQQTNMPPGGSAARASQLATLSSLAHDLFTSDSFGEGLERVESALDGANPDSDEARLVAHTRRNFDKQRRVTSDWVSRFSHRTSIAQTTWQKSRSEDDFSIFQDDLVEIFKLQREYCGFFAPYEHIYDPLLDDYEPGMKTATVTALFDRLQADQVELVARIAEQPQLDDSPLHQKFAIDRQWDFGLEVIRDLGYDFERGRQDKSPHPFTSGFSIDDVRITSRFYPDFLSPGLFATLHEAGHALYGQGVKREFERTPMVEGASLGIHESQSRLWENLVGRSRPFWVHYYPKLQEYFPVQLGQVDETAFYQAVNTVRPSLIRVEADEATYNLHIMLRFEIEKGLLTDEMNVADLPEIWNSKFEEYLGILPPSNADGVLQDIHWSFGLVGYFPTYSLGNLIASQWWQVIQEQIPDLDQQISSGEFGDLLAWLRENIHRHGAKYKPVELIERVTGTGLSARPYLDYLHKKFGQLYSLS